MLPEAAAYCRYTDAEGTVEVVFNSKLEALLAGEDTAGARPWPEAHRGERHTRGRGTPGARGQGDRGEGGEGHGHRDGGGGSECLPLEAFLRALLGPHWDEARALLPLSPLPLCTRKSWHRSCHSLEGQAHSAQPPEWGAPCSAWLKGAFVPLAPGAPSSLVYVCREGGSLKTAQGAVARCGGG